MPRPAPPAASPLLERAYGLCRTLQQQGGRVFGLNGPQGCGKSTLVAALVARAAEDGLRFVTLSADDLYLTNAEQKALALRFPHDPLLQVRGAPGTHDVDLGITVIEALRAGRPTPVPRYDKSAFGGQGDRADPATWPRVPRVDLVLFEGWTLGFAPVGVSGALAQVDTALRNYAAWTERADAWLQLRTADPANIVAWRMEAEAQRARALGADRAMSPVQARAYIERFLPLYAVYPEALARSALRPEVIWLDAARRWIG